MTRVGGLTNSAIGFELLPPFSNAHSAQKLTKLIYQPPCDNCPTLAVRFFEERSIRPKRAAFRAFVYRSRP
eukprot:1690126-Heterocapsa_arctica.AAC.1